MNPEALAALHARAFDFPPPWSAASFAALLADPAVHLIADPEGRGFALSRSIAGEAELLTLAVDPRCRREGIARGLLARLDETWRARGVAQAFLEVAETNTAARRLYATCGWHEAGRRPGYYTRAGQPAVAAITLCKSLA